MNRLLAKFTGRAVKNWQAFSTTIDEGVRKIREAGSPASNYEAEVSAARAAFTAAPSPALCRKWMEAESLRQAAAVVVEELRNLGNSARDELLHTPEAQGKLRDALEEILAALTAKRDAVVAADKARADETGVEEPSVNTLAAIDREIQQVEGAKGWIGPDPGRAASAIQTFLA
jgi:hypothetical protein